MNLFKQQLFDLLSIQAPSGKEKKVINWLKPKLARLTDKVIIDGYGNLLAEKVVGDGKGATVVLSAHMDTVSNIKKGRRVLYNKATQTFYSSKGVLGADDRAGIAIILAVLRNLNKTEFNGTIKVCFSREEEIGCIGAEKIPFDFYKDANLAIVVDRRGSRDIVTGCSYPYNFCSEAVGEFFENVSSLLDMDWKAVGGGVSDAMVFSSKGINSVNLSAGYMNEHTEKEYVNINHCRDTINLILQALSVINTQYHKFGQVPDPYYYSFNDNICYMRDEYDFLGEAVFYDDDDSFGNVTGTAVAGYISLLQKDTTTHEVFMKETNFRRLIDQYCLVTGYKVGSELEAYKKRRNKDKEAERSLVSLK